MKKILIKNSRVVDPFNHIDGKRDILINNGVIEKVEAEICSGADIIIDAEGLVSAPGLVDMHVHLRDPGLLYKEDIFTGCQAAAAGGVTSVAAMPNTDPPVDSVEQVRYILDKARSAKAKVYPVACITKGMKSKELCDIKALKAAGAIAVSDDGRPVETAKLMLTGMKEADSCGIPAISHCEILELVKGGIMNEGEISAMLGVKGMPRQSEDIATERELALAGISKCRVHIAHVSTAGSCELIRSAKSQGIRVTAETAPHYFTLTEEALLSRNADFRMNPPLRTKTDREAIINALKDGTVDVIATDHAPHAAHEKSDFEKAPNGIVGLETSLALGITNLVSKGHITLSRLIELMSLNPAKILKLNAGTLSIGAPADIVIFNEIKEWKVDKTRFYSKSKNTPFDGMVLKGRVIKTILNGEIVYEDKEGDRSCHLTD